MSGMVHRRKPGTNLKSVCGTLIIILALNGVSAASPSGGEWRGRYSSAAGFVGHHGASRESLGVGLSPALFPCGDGRAGLRPAPTDFCFTVSSGGERLEDPETAKPLSSPGTPEKTSTPPDEASSIRDSLPSPPATLGPPTPGTGVSRRARHLSGGGFSHSPTGALLKSVAFPGWGQWSNGKKQKAAVYFGIETYFLTKALIWRHRTFDRLHAWGNTDPGDATARQAAFNNFDSARNSRNYFYWLTGITVFISMFDAYADSYLLTFERTRNMGDDYWGGQALFAPNDEVCLIVSFRF